MLRALASRLAVLAALHFVMDAYSSFLTPLLPLLMQRLHLSLTMVGTLVALSSITSSFGQPLFGWLADRVHRPWFVTVAPLLAGVFLPALGLAPTFGWLVACLMLGGLGAAAFHPQGSVLAIGAAPRRVTAMSVFVSCGTLGFSLGPLLSVAVVSAFGLSRTWIAAAPGLVMFIAMVVLFPRMTPRTRRVGPRPALAELKPVARPLALLYLAVVCRSAVSFGFMTFLPVMLHTRGYTLPAVGAMLTCYLGAGAVGGFLGGWLADRWGARRIVVQSFAGSLPLFYAFLVLPTGPGLACLFAGALVLQGSLPVNVVLGQELSPRHASTISSLLMGAAWGVGQLCVGPTGALADKAGLVTALAALSVLLGVGLASALALPALRTAPARATELVAPASQV
jgi:MFS transporter, FSR family, fosmidomycin resistance protein